MKAILLIILVILLFLGYQWVLYLPTSISKIESEIKKEENEKKEKIKHRKKKKSVCILFNFNFLGILIATLLFFLILKLSLIALGSYTIPFLILVSMPLLIAGLKTLFVRERDGREREDKKDMKKDMEKK